MKTRTTVITAATFAAAIAIFAPIKPSEAGTCPTTPVSGGRVFEVIQGTCIATGEGQPSDLSGYTFLDKVEEGDIGAGILEVTGIDTTGGTWKYTSNDMYKAFVLVLKSGALDNTPDWGAFALGDEPSAMGSWSVSPTDLSNAQLYAQVVPIPAALPLMLGALAGLGLIARRKKDV
jgi:hypothetical protein